jgi:hypothetical protein
MDFAGFDGDIIRQSTDLLKKANEDSRWLERTIISFIQFQKQRVDRNEIVPTTISNYTKPLKTFLDMNDYMDGRINWKKIRRGLPPRKNAADDRPPTREEIKKLLESAITVPPEEVEAATSIPIETTIPSDAINTTTLSSSTTPTTPTVTTDPSQSTVELPSEAASAVVQEKTQQPLPDAAVTTDTTENNADVDNADKIISTAEESQSDASSGDNIENVEDDDDKPTDSVNTNIDDSGTTSSPR